MGAVGHGRRRDGRAGRGAGRPEPARRAAWSLALAAALALSGTAARAAQITALKGAEAEGYGRIALAFDKPVPVTARVAGNVLVLSFGEAGAGGRERLAEEMPAYVSAVRRDPDGTGFRLAMPRPYRINVQAAGEKVFVDLLPAGWSGLPPPLPADVVADLARRAREAEAALKARAPAPPRRTLSLEAAHLPTLTRLSLRLPPDAQASTTVEAGATRVRIAGAWTIDTAQARGRPRPGLGRLATEADEGSASLVATPAEGYAISVEREDDALVLDIVRKAPPPAAAPEEATRADPGRAAGKPGPGRTAAAAKPAPRPEERTADAADPAEAPRAPREAPDAPAATESPERPAGTGLVYAPQGPTPAALFERAGVATLVLETAETPQPRAGASAPRALGEAVRRGRFLVQHFAVPAGHLLDILPVGATGWELSLGEGLSAGDSLAVARRPEAGGRSALVVDLPRPGAAGWLDLDGERVAVVTSLSRRPAGLPKRQRFVDLELLPSRLGLAVLALADDVSVRPDIDGVAVGRGSGLSLSPPPRRPDPPLAPAETIAIDRPAWEAARLGNVRDALRAQFAAAVEAPPGERGPRRLALARTLIANGLDPEALAVLEAGSADDPLLAAARETAVLRALAQARLGRVEEARQTLSAESLRRDPEAALWRAHVEALAGNWREAETGFGRTLGLVERYPDDLQALLRTSAAESAVETGDVETAAHRIAGTSRRDLPPLLRDRLALAKARVEEAVGQSEAALDAYGRLAEEAAWPVAAAATLRGTLLGLALDKLDTQAAVERLERLNVTWHGGETEDAITAGLARLFISTGRWREAFGAIRRANVVAPNAPASRALHSEAQALFDDLFLTAKGDSLSGTEAVALYFDYKEFAPIGRRGDEIVRRLADRLVSLDLLDSASELLQHQIDHRLTGAARAAVAARLATVRLMDGKPLMALDVLDATHLPDLPADLRRARALVRARALSDVTRTDLALETIEDEAGPEVERARADILWAARRWRGAGEAHEALLGEVWRGTKPLDEAARADAIRAGIAYNLAGDALGLERLKAKFAGPMAQGPDARTFALLTAANATRDPAFREIARRATSAETLAAFLAEYRKRYPEAAVPDRGRPAADAAGRADAPAAPPG